MVNAGQVMTAPVVSVSPESSLAEAVRIFAENGISGAPVVENSEHVVGIITEKDIVKFASGSHVISLFDSTGWVSPHTEVRDLTELRRGAELLNRTPVRKVMTKKVFTVTEDTPGPKAAALMNKRNINHVPVVSAENKLVGIICRGDMVRYLAGREAD